MPETNTRLDAPLCQPELTIWFDLPPELAAQRRSGARAPDRFEAQPVDFFRRVAEGYTQRAAEAPRRFVRIDATQERHQVWQQLVHAFVYRGWLAADAHAAPPVQLAKHDGADRQ